MSEKKFDPFATEPWEYVEDNENDSWYVLDKSNDIILSYEREGKPNRSWADPEHFELITNCVNAFKDVPPGKEQELMDFVDELLEGSVALNDCCTYCGGELWLYEHDESCPIGKLKSLLEPKSTEKEVENESD